MFRGEAKSDEQPISSSCDTGNCGAVPGCTLPEAQPVRQIAEADVVETALAHALTAATESRQWEVVAQLVRELQARREARDAPEVARLQRSQAKRR